MKISLINGSPKAKNSCSDYLLKEIKKLLAENINTLCINILNDGVCSNIYASINFPKDYIYLKAITPGLLWPKKMV